MVNQTLPTPKELVEMLRDYVERAVAQNRCSTAARKPNHRYPFHWPPHPISYSFHVLRSDWTGRASFQAHGEEFSVEVARTPDGVFGRCPALWHEARGETLEEMLRNLKSSAEPLFMRQLIISDTLGLKGRFEGHVNDLAPADLLKLLYCRDRDVANDARIQIETRASQGIYGPALVEILLDRRHPDRRGAQWCVLDLFEDIESFFHSPVGRDGAIAAMKGLLWDAEDDYARTVYKAGVVLGGHVPGDEGGAALLQCLRAPSKIGRRSAIHGLFHVVEWYPHRRREILDALEEVSIGDPELVLREYSAAMARDIRENNFDHVSEPVFAEEM